MKLFKTSTIATAIIFSSCAKAQIKQIIIPLGGNCFITSVMPTSDSIADEGITRWKDSTTVFSIFFRNDKKCTVQFGLKDDSKSKSIIELRTGKSSATLELQETGQYVFSDDFIFDPGYHCVQLKGIKKNSEQFANVSNLILKTATPDSVFHFVRENTGNRFYWGRRGPSLHLSYETPRDINIEWFYSELNVPKGSDVPGSYFMANGFKEGYFGMQVNDEKERRILFSIWSPAETDDPSAIPEDEKIIMLKKGENVHTGEFGNEGAGGQSYFIYPWIAGSTCRFLTHVKPDGNGSTIYTAYFYPPETNQWILIASFQRPKTNTWLTRPHSFIENFIDTNGFHSRRCNYGNQWIMDTEGNWHESTKAFFTGDDIANIRYRMDYTGGVSANTFFLQNGGFTNDNTPLKQYFIRKPGNNPPQIDLARLP